MGAVKWVGIRDRDMVPGNITGIRNQDADKSWVGTCPHCPHGSYATGHDGHDAKARVDRGKAHPLTFDS